MSHEEMPSVLKRIEIEKKEEVRSLILSGRASEYRNAAQRIEPGEYFMRSISQDTKSPMNLIAEFKRASPSAGNINSEASLRNTIKTYDLGGASAISILTDKHFNSSLEDLKEARKITGKPILRKDFIIHPAQIYESNVYGADAILLIAALLDKEQLIDYQALANELGMDALVESHNLGELEMSLEAGAKIIGINNRNLHTLNTDIKITKELMRYVSKDKIVVTESGICSLKDVRYLTKTKWHPHSMLVGSSLMSAENVRERIRGLLIPKKKHLF